LDLAAAAFEARLNRALSLADAAPSFSEPSHVRQDSGVESPALWNKTIAMLADVELRQRNLEQTRAAVALELEHAKKMMAEARALWSNAQALKQDLEAKQARMELECVCKNRTAVRALPSDTQAETDDLKQLKKTDERPTGETITRKFFKNGDAEEVRGLQWGSILQSKLTMWHRPKRQHIKYLKDENCTLIISVQSEKEQAADVGKDCSKFGIRWIHIPLEGANETLLSAEESITVVLEGLYAVFKMLNNNQEKALVHCAAGIHRTGVCTYVLARVAGRTKKEATSFLKQLREVTFAQVGDWRLALAEEILVPRLKERIQHQISVNNLKLV
jgi:protein-tyrosine phosphatase